MPTPTTLQPGEVPPLGEVLLTAAAHARRLTSASAENRSRISAGVAVLADLLDAQSAAGTARALTLIEASEMLSALEADLVHLDVLTGGHGGGQTVHHAPGETNPLAAAAAEPEPDVAAVTHRLACAIHAGLTSRLPPATPAGGGWQLAVAAHRAARLAELLTPAGAT